MLPTKNYFVLLFTFLSFTAHAQTNITGQVTDAETTEGIAFATILFQESKTGIAADIDGFFKFSANFKSEQLRFSAIGYKSKYLSIEQLQVSNYLVTLKKSPYNIDEVEILSGENPAHRIVNKAIDNRKQNNPELSSPFFYESYNKMVFISPMDSNSTSKLDSVTIRSIQKESIDSFPNSKVSFIMESVSERNHYPPTKTQEVIKESRVAGFKTPFISILATQLQSFSLYQDYVIVYGISYLSPISKGSTSNYLFILEDTLFQGTDTSFIISFRPRKNKNFKALAGVLSINTNGFAVENFIAKQHDSSGFPVKIQQRYELVENKQWFPTQLHLDILFSSTKSKSGVIGRGKSYLRNISLTPKVSEKEIGNLALKMDENIAPKSEEGWEKIREIPLSVREQITYSFIDSIGEAENLDRSIFILKGLVKGYVPIGKFNLLLNKLLSFNQYENVRLGAGVETGESLLGPIRIGAYGGYGFRDKAWKYGSHIRWIPTSDRQFETKFTYSNDLIAVGKANFFRPSGMLFSGGEFQNFINDQFDNQEKWESSISFRALRDFHFTLFGNHQKRNINSNYTFINSENEAINSFTNSEIGVNFRFSFNEKFGEFLGVTMPIETKNPVINFKFTKGVATILNADFDYDKIDISFSKKFILRNLGTTSLQADFGYVNNALPLTALYSLKGIFDENVRVASSNSFETMAPNEFFADQHISLFFRHNFGSLLFNKPNFKPELLLVSSFGIGSLRERDRHQNFDLSVPEKGFLESGIQLNNLYRIKYLYKGIYFGIGAGTYYRYGAYANPEFKDNIAVKLTGTFTM
jgi:hypothetical protein